MPACCLLRRCSGRQEFVQYLPEATQGVIVQPIGKEGVMVVGTDTLRGLSRLDQVGVIVRLAGTSNLRWEGGK